MPRFWETPQRGTRQPPRISQPEPLQPWEVEGGYAATTPLALPPGEGGDGGLPSMAPLPPEVQPQPEPPPPMPLGEEEAPPTAAGRGLYIPGVSESLVLRMAKKRLPQIEQPDPLQSEDEVLPSDEEILSRQSASRGIYIPGVSESLALRMYPKEIRAEIEPLLSYRTSPAPKDSPWERKSSPTVFGEMLLDGIRRNQPTQVAEGALGLAGEAQQAAEGLLQPFDPINQAWMTVNHPFAGWAGVTKEMEIDPASSARRIRRAVDSYLEETKVADITPLSALKGIGDKLWDDPVPFWTGAYSEAVNPLNWIGPGEIASGGRILFTAAEALSKARPLVGLRPLLADALETASRVGSRLPYGIRIALADEAGHIRFGNDAPAIFPDSIQHYIEKFRADPSTTWDGTRWLEDGKPAKPSVSKELTERFGNGDNLSSYISRQENAAPPFTYQADRDPGMLAAMADDALKSEFAAAPKTAILRPGRTIFQDDPLILSTTAVPPAAGPGRVMVDVESRLDNPRLVQSMDELTGLLQRPSILEELKRQGYDSVYLPETRAGGGLIVVLDKAKVSALLKGQVLTEEMITAMRQAERAARGGKEATAEAGAGTVSLKPFSAKLYRGSGRAEKGAVYTPVESGGLGEATFKNADYYAFDKETAAQFGPNVQEHSISLSNPLTVTGDVQWRALTRDAGLEFPNPFGQSEVVQRRELDKLQNHITARGYDGLVIRMSDIGDEAKTLRKVWGDDQVIVFRSEAGDEAGVGAAAGGVTPRYSGITPEASALLETHDAGGVPSTVTRNMARIARENGITPAQYRDKTPNELIAMLRAKAEVTPSAGGAGGAGGAGKAADLMTARPGFRYRSFNNADEAIGPDRSTSAAPFQHGGAFEIEVKGRSGHAIEHHPGAMRGPIEPSDVTKIFYDTEETPSIIQQELPKLRAKFPDAEVIPFKSGDDADIRVLAQEPNWLSTPAAGKAKNALPGLPDKPNASTGQAALRRAEQAGYDVEDATASLEDYRAISRADYDDSAGFLEDRQEAWDEFRDMLAQSEKLDPGDLAPGPAGVGTGAPPSQPPAPPSNLPPVPPLPGEFGDFPFGPLRLNPITRDPQAEIESLRRDLIPLVRDARSRQDQETADLLRRLDFSAREYGPGRASDAAFSDQMAQLRDLTQRIDQMRPGIRQQALGDLAKRLNAIYEPAPGWVGSSPLFSPEVEALLARVKDTGLDRRMYEYALQSSSVPGDPVGALRQSWNELYSIVTPTARFDPAIRTSFMEAGHYASAQAQRIVERRVAVMGSIQEAFGTVTAEKIPALADALESSARAYLDNTSSEKYIGTLWHVVDNPQLYELTPKQYRAAKAWQEVLDEELEFSNTLGLGHDLIEGAWVGRSFKPRPGTPTGPELGRGGQGVGAAMPSFFRQRRLDTQQFLDYAQQHGLEVETDLATLLSSRLAGTARIRTENSFLRSIAEKTGGRELALGETVSPTVTRFTTAGKSYAIPEQYAAQTRELLEGQSVSGGAQFFDEAIDQFRNLLLNFDASVGYGRQGLLSFMADPAGTLRDWGHTAQMAFDPHRMAILLATEGERMAWWKQRGLVMDVTPTDVARGLSDKERRMWTDYIPGLAQFNEFQFGLVMPILKMHRAEVLQQSLVAMRDHKGVFGNINKVLEEVPAIGGLVRKMRGGLDTMTDDEISRVVADSVNNFLGGADWAKIGTRPRWQRPFLLTEGWLRGQVNTFKNAASLGTPEGILARRLVASELAGSAMLASALALAVNNGDIAKLPDYDPRSPRFLDVLWGDTWVTILPHKSIIRAIAIMLMGQDPEFTGKEREPMEQRTDAFWSFLQGRAGQVPRIAMDIAKEQDFYGNPIGEDLPSRAAYIGSQLMPIIAQQIYQDWKDGTAPPERFKRAGMQFLGLGVRGPSAVDLVAGMGGNIPGRTQYYNAGAVVARYLAGDDEPMYAALKEYGDLKTESSGDNRAAAQKIRQRMVTIGERYPEQVKQYNSAYLQFRKGIRAAIPQLDQLLRIYKTEEEATESPFPTPPPPVRPAPPADLNGAWESDYAKDYLALLASKQWDRLGSDGKPLHYNQLTPAEHKGINDLLERLDAEVQKRSKTPGLQWHNVSTPTKRAILSAVGITKTSPAEKRDYYNRIATQLGLPLSGQRPPEPRVTPTLPAPAITATPIPRPIRTPVAAGR